MKRKIGVSSKAYKIRNKKNALKTIKYDKNHPYSHRSVKPVKCNSKKRGTK